MFKVTYEIHVYSFQKDSSYSVLEGHSDHPAPLISLNRCNNISLTFLEETNFFHSRVVNFRYYKWRNAQPIKDLRAKIFYSIEFFKLLLRTDNDLLVLEMK